MSNISDIRALIQLAAHGQANLAETLEGIDEICQRAQDEAKSPRNSPGRDTQFAGWAAITLKDLDDAIGQSAKRADVLDEKAFARELAQGLGLILARRGYDLVEHTLRIVPHLLYVVPDVQHLREVIPHVPDMPALPEVQEHDH